MEEEGLCTEEWNQELDEPWHSYTAKYLPLSLKNKIKQKFKKKPNQHKNPKKTDKQTKKQTPQPTKKKSQNGKNPNKQTNPQKSPKPKPTMHLLSLAVTRPEKCYYWAGAQGLPQADKRWSPRGGAAVVHCFLLSQGTQKPLLSCASPAPLALPGSSVECQGSRCSAGRGSAPGIVSFSHRSVHVPTNRTTHSRKEKLWAHTSISDCHKFLILLQ